MSQRTIGVANVDGSLAGLAPRRQARALPAIMAFLSLSLSACVVNPDKEYGRQGAGREVSGGAARQ